MTQPIDPVTKGVILVVDDNPANLTVLSDMLTGDGYEVRAALSGALAVRAALASPPDLVLLDINMPGMNGYDVCRELKAAPGTRDVPIVFISALDAIGDKVMAFESGGADYVTKPFQMREVLARVHTQLTLVRQRAELVERRRELDDRYRQIRELYGVVRGQSPPDSAAPEEPGSTRAARRTVTVLATEIHGFARIAERTAPDRLLADLDVYVASATRTIADHVGEIAHVRGDAVLAFFNDAGRALRAACHLQRRVADLNAARVAASEPPFGTRAGLATGPALLARRGPSARREITLIGDVVTLAERLQGDARPGGIFMDNATFDLAGRPQDTRHSIMRIRGRTDMLKAHELLPDAALRLHEAFGAPGPPGDPDR